MTLYADTLNSQNAARGWSRLSSARMWLRPGVLVVTPGLTAQLETGW